jgi:hypothetical protein
MLRPPRPPLLLLHHHHHHHHHHLTLLLLLPSTGCTPPSSPTPPPPRLGWPPSSPSEFLSCGPAAPLTPPGPPTWRPNLARQLVKFVPPRAHIVQEGRVCGRSVWSWRVSLVEAVPTAIMAVRELGALFVCITNPLLAIYGPKLTLRIGGVARPAASAAAASSSSSSRPLRQVAPARRIVDQVAPGRTSCKFPSYGHPRTVTDPS